MPFAIDIRSLAPVSNQRGIGLTAHEQRETGQEHGLTGTGFAGDGRESGGESNPSLVDDSEISNPNALNHDGPASP